jgi:hypothetical protein
LSGLIAATAPWFGGSVDMAGLLLPPLLSSLFMLPLFWCCWRLGSPAAGLMGGLVGTFCIEYYRRTSIGWVDTDALNLSFAWLVCALFLSMSGTQSRARLLLRSALAGAVWFVFARWYPKPGLSLLFIVALAGHLALAGVGWRRVLLGVGVFAVFAGPSQWGDAWFSLRDAATVTSAWRSRYPPRPRRGSASQRCGGPSAKPGRSAWAARCGRSSRART